MTLLDDYILGIHHLHFQMAYLSGIFILSIVFLVTVFRKKRVAVSIAVWLAIFELLHMGRKTLADHPLTILAVLAWIGIAVFLAKTLPKPAVKKKESWITGVWITLGMLLVLEAACDIIIHNKCPCAFMNIHPWLNHLGMTLTGRL